MWHRIDKRIANIKQRNVRLQERIEKLCSLTERQNFNLDLDEGFRESYCGNFMVKSVPFHIVSQPRISKS